MTPTSQYFLSKGKHSRASDGRCAMEWVSYLAGEPHSDQPVCVSPVLRRFCIALNDNIGDEERQKLRPYLARCIGTVGDGRDDERIRMCIEFLRDTAFPTLLAHDEVALSKLADLPWELALENVDRFMEVRQGALRIALEARERAYDRLRKAAGAAGAAGAAEAAEAAEAAGAAWAAEAAGAAWAAGAAGAAGAAEAAEAAGAAWAAWAAGAAARKVIYAAAYAKSQELAADLNPKAFALLERMLPLEVIQLPVVEDAALVCRAPEVEAVR